MNWRRGLLYALVHLLVVLPIIVHLRVADWSARNAGGEQRTLLKEAKSQEDAVGWDPMAICCYPSPMEAIVGVTNLPAAILSGWKVRNSYSDTALAGVMHHLLGRDSVKGDVILDTCFLGLIFAQWLILGALPNWTRPLPSSPHPALINTVLGGCALLIAFLPLIHDFYRLPLLLILATWFVWFLVGIWQLSRYGIRRATNTSSV